MMWLTDDVRPFVLGGVDDGHGTMGGCAAMTDLSAYRVIGRGRPAWRGFDPGRLPRLSRGLVVACAMWVLIVVLAQRDSGAWVSGKDAISYWAPQLDALYAQAEWTTVGAYVYSPAFLQLVSPLQHLPWLAFVGVWTAMLMFALRFLTGGRLFAIGVLLAAGELIGGNISLLLAVAIVIGFRWPAAWALILLTKVTPGIGLLWFAARGEWRNLSIAIAATVVVIAVSAAVMPWAWPEWIGVLTNIAGRDGTWAAVPIPLLVRLPFAIAVVVWGARTDRRWTVPVACMLALPALWYGGLTMLLAIIVLRDRPRHAGEELPQAFVPVAATEG